MDSVPPGRNGPGTQGPAETDQGNLRRVRGPEAKSEERQGITPVPGRDEQKNEHGRRGPEGRSQKTFKEAGRQQEDSGASSCMRSPTEMTLKRNEPGAGGNGEQSPKRGDSRRTTKTGTKSPIDSNRPPPKGRLFAQGTVARAMGVTDNTLAKMHDSAHIRPYIRLTHKKTNIRGYDTLGVATAFRIPMDLAEARLNESADELLGMLTNPATGSDRVRGQKSGTFQDVLDKEVERWRLISEEESSHDREQGTARMRGPVEMILDKEMEAAARLNMAPRYTPPPRGRLYTSTTVARALGITNTSLWGAEKRGKVRMYAEFQRGTVSARGYTAEDVGLGYGLNPDEAKVSLERAISDVIERRDSITSEDPDEGISMAVRSTLSGLTRAIELQNFLDTETQKWRTAHE